MNNNKVFYGILSYKDEMERCAELGVPGFLTNSQHMLNVFGPDMTIDEMVDEALANCHGIPVFPHIHGATADEMIDVGLRIHRKNPELVGCKILANEEGFKAIKVLNEHGMKVVVTGMYTFAQGLVAAQVGAFAVSPFVHRGNDAGLDMGKVIRDLRAAYNRMEDPPLIIAASIRDWDDALLALENGADALASNLVFEACESEISKTTEMSFAKAFAKMKGEDVSYVLNGFDCDHSFEE